MQNIRSLRVPLLADDKTLFSQAACFFDFGMHAIGIFCTFEAELKRRYGEIGMRVEGRARLRGRVDVSKPFAGASTAGETANSYTTTQQYNVCTEATAQPKEACTASSAMQQAYSVLSAAQLTLGSRSVDS